MKILGAIVVTVSMIVINVGGKSTCLYDTLFLTAYRWKGRTHWH